MFLRNLFLQELKAHIITVLELPPIAFCNIRVRAESL